MEGGGVSLSNLGPFRQSEPKQERNFQVARVGREEIRL
jgi:hypothetical protein